MADLVRETQPLGLFLNGVTALYSLLGFARTHRVRFALSGLPRTAEIKAWRPKQVMHKSEEIMSLIFYLISAPVVFLFSGRLESCV